MAYDRFLIGPYSKGLTTDVAPWALPEDAFTTLDNAYIYEGAIHKRFGSRLLNTFVDQEKQQWLSRLRINLNNDLDANGERSNIYIPGAVLRTGQIIAITTGPPDYTIESFIYQGAGVFKSSIDLKTASYTPATQMLSIQNVVPNNEFAGCSVYYYPCDPVLGFAKKESGNINNEPVYAFDKQFAYQRPGGAEGGWERLADGLWTGTNDNYPWAATWTGEYSYQTLLFVTNNVARDIAAGTGDGIKYYSEGIGTWTTLTPIVNSNTGDHMLTARIVIAFAGMLLALNTTEEFGGGRHTYGNRMRACQRSGDPRSVDAWDCFVPGRGFYSNAPTKQSIMTASIVKNRLIVYFEYATYELVYTGNDVIPFVWQQINSELGCQATFSKINFDDSIIAIGATGIHSCNGSNVTRIDNTIQNEVARIFASTADFNKTYSIRDLRNKMIYWSFVDANYTENRDNVYCNRVLAFNYDNGSWSYFDDSITAFGYYSETVAASWDTIHAPWDDYDEFWDGDTLQSRPARIIAGNHQGFTFLVDTHRGANAPSLSIANINNVNAHITCYKHNLRPKDYVYINSAVGLTVLNNTIFETAIVNEDTFRIILRSGQEMNLLAEYHGKGTATLVSRPDIRTKPFNTYVKNNRAMNLQKVDIYVTNNGDGLLQLECLLNNSSVDFIREGSYTNSILSSGVIELGPYATKPLEVAQNSFWRSLYLNAVGSSLQLKITMSDNQIINTARAFTPFQINAMVLVARPLGRDMIAF